MAVQKLQRCENTAFHIHAAPFGTRSRPRPMLPPGARARARAEDASVATQRQVNLELKTPVIPAEV